MELLYWILFVCYASYAFNRKSVVFSMSMLKEDEGLDASDAGLIISCQNIAFSISQFVIGVVSDSLNPNLLFSAGLVVSGLATLIFSTSSSASTFCCLWFLNGLAQGCGWPACAKIITQRASPTQFGTLWSVLSASNNFACSLGPIISAYILVHYGWRYNVFSAGLLTLMLLGLFLFTLPFLSDVKNPQSEDKKSASSEKKDEQTTIWDLFRDPYIWILSVSYLVMFCARTTSVDWGQIYLIDEKKHSQYVASAFTSSVETGGFIGRIAAGYMTDWVIARSMAYAKKDIPSKPVLRISVSLIFILGSVIFLHLFQFAVSEASSTMWIMFVGFSMGLSYYGPIAILGIVSSEAVPPHLSGASHAIVALFGNIGATISGMPFNYIAKYYNWSTVFLMLEVLAAGTLLLMVRCRKMVPKIGKPKED